MKRFRKALLALTALLGVVIVGGIWLINSALNVVSDAADATFDGAHKVEAVAQRELIGTARSAQEGANIALSGAKRSVEVLDTAASTQITPTAAPANKVTEQNSKNETSHVPQPVSKTNPQTSPAANQTTNQQDDGDDFANISRILGMFLNDGEEGPDLQALITPGEQEAKGDRSASAQGDDTLTDMIPGMNSPTVKGWMAGKYKGNEEQALDDALEDPQIWRLILFLNGGM